jgi:hypothetical protein
MWKRLIARAIRIEKRPLNEAIEIVKHYALGQINVLEWPYYQLDFGADYNFGGFRVYITTSSSVGFLDSLDISKLSLTSLTIWVSV